MLCHGRKSMMLCAVFFFTIGLGQARSDTIAVRVAASADDGEENVISGAMEALDSSDLELGLERVPDDGEGIQIAGMRFLGVNVPAGSTINSAAIQFTVDENDKGPAAANFGILGQLSPNPVAFTNADGDITDRPSASNAVAWINVPSWTGQVGMAGPDQRTPDISAIVQEIIDQPGWVAGNAMAFGVVPIDAAGDIDPTSQANRTAESFDGVPTSAPLLEIDFTPIPEPSTVILAAFGFVALLYCGRRRVK